MKPPGQYRIIKHISSLYNHKEPNVQKWFIQLETNMQPAIDEDYSYMNHFIFNSYYKVI